MQSRERWQDARATVPRLPERIRSIDSPESGHQGLERGCRARGPSSVATISSPYVSNRAPGSLIQYTEYVTHDLFSAERSGPQKLLAPERDLQQRLVWMTG